MYLLLKNNISDSSNWEAIATYEIIPSPEELLNLECFGEGSDAKHKETGESLNELLCKQLSEKLITSTFQFSSSFRFEYMLIEFKHGEDLNLHDYLLTGYTDINPGIGFDLDNFC
ncbi:gp236 [Sphingomonas phage PAU]|uniref:gp236 n=1 Tax=Sphingomonas phage PAU TaxID=1150991 RepID=UPI000257338A|nr:gp236 [Sphingomonas phage PAU]AFF28234.1 gp236 [Sphingomonas phage PAU]